MAHDTDPANLTSKAKPDCHTIRHNATRSRHTIPATPHSPHDPTSSTRYHVTHTASQPATAWQDIAQRTA